MAVVPDKGYYLAEANGYLSMDYEQFFVNMQEKMPYAEYIELTDLLEADDYYYTDSHWRQEKIVDVAEYLKEAMRDENRHSAFIAWMLKKDFNSIHSPLYKLLVL